MLKRLSCKRMARVMPLYVAGDLEQQREGKVARHLALCEKCRELAGEFSESQRLTAASYADPGFDKEFYSELRRTVLAEIGRSENQRKTWFTGWRLVYAASLIITLSASALLFQYFRHGAVESSQPADAAFEVHANTSPSTGPVSGNEVRPEVEHPRVALHSREARSQLKVKRAPNTLGVAQLKQDKTNNSKQARRVVTVVATADKQAGSSRSREAEVSRIEIMTSDPNIRIIWLTSREAHQSEEAIPDQIKDQSKEPE